MEKRVLRVCLTLTGIFIFSSAFPQGEVLQELQEEARGYMNAANYRKAYDTYEKILAIDSEDPQYNFEMGVCIYKGAFDKSQSLPYFEKALDNRTEDTSPELYYYLGKAYHYQSNFLFAIAAYSTAKAYIKSSKAGRELESEIDELIDQCERGKNKVKEQQLVVLADKGEGEKDVYKYYVDGNRYVKIENLGPIINTEYSEYGPIFLGDNRTMLFTSRRMGTGAEMYHDDQYYEDIYIAHFDGKAVHDVANINESDYFDYALKNTARHDATVSISNDEKQLFIYYNNHVMELINENGSWSQPTELSKNVAEEVNHITSATLNSDGTRLLMVGNKETDTYGGRDIYYAEKQGDGWGALVNFGEPINTPSDESSPYMPNDTTLYFSSKGHMSIGGYDVFVSHKRDGKWQEPKDLNIPINTPFNEINYRVSNDREFAYYASERAEGYGHFDIYRITKGFEVKVDEALLATFEDVPEDSLPGQTFIKEKTLEYEPGHKPPGEELSAKEKLVAQEGGATIDQDEKEMLDELSKDESVTIEKTDDGTIEVTESFDDAPIKVSDLNRAALEDLTKFNIPNKVTYRDKYAGTFIFEEKAHFGFNSTMLTDYSKSVIQPVLDFLEDNPNKKFTIRLYGHTDSKGGIRYNMQLASERVASVKNYLVGQGVNEADIETKSYGEARPAVSVETPETAIYNRRVQVRVYLAQ